MALRKEFLNAGLVQTRHATLLRPGELQQADDTILRPGDIAIHKAPGRTTYGTVRTTALSTTTIISTTGLTSSGLFGTAFTNVDWDDDSITLTGITGALTTHVGMSVIGTGIPAGTIITRYISATSLEISKLTTAAGVNVTITISNLHPGMFIAGTGITAGTTIASITDASNLVMSLVAISSGTVSRSFSAPVSGLRALSFDGNLSDVLLAQSLDTLYTAPLAAGSPPTGTFASLAIGLSQETNTQLDTIQFKNRHVVLNGYDKPRVVYYQKSATAAQAVAMRTLGMLPVDNSASIVPAVVSGTWSGLTDFGNGYYYFLVTEVLIVGKDDEVEGTFTGDPIPYANITDYNTQSIQITYQTAANLPINNGLLGANTATHWRVYMSPRQADLFPAPDLAVFRRVAEVPFSVNTIKLADQAPFQSGYAAALWTYTSHDPLFPAGNTNALSSVAAQVIANCTTAIGPGPSGYILTCATPAFSASMIGMVVTSTNDRIPYGTTVHSVPTTTTLVMSAAATVAGTESVGFGNKPCLEGTLATCPANQSFTTTRGGIFRNFGINNIGGFAAITTITGIKVEIPFQYQEHQNGENRGFIVNLVKGGNQGAIGTLSNALEAGAFGQSGIKGIITLGGPTETWGITWAATDFINGDTTWGVLVRKNNGATGELPNHYIDGVKVTIYGGTSSVNLDGEPFRTVVISDQINTEGFGTGAAGPPPIASTGDIFEGMLLLNDTADESAVVASLPDEEESFPDVYRLSIESKDSDRVRVIRKLGNACIIGCLNSVKRLNYFPKETDADFNQGRCYEDIASDHGMVGPRAAKIVDLPGRGAILAYLSHNGMHWTDGVTSQYLNQDINWETLIEPTLIHRSVLEVYPKLSILALYYVPTGGTRATRALYFSYHPTHIKEGLQLPATGPIIVDAASAAAILISGVPYLFTGNSWDGTVYTEDQGTYDYSIAGGPLPAIRTRQLYLADMGYVGRVERLWLMVDADGNSTTGAITVTPTIQSQDQAQLALDAVTEKTTVTGGIISVFSDQAAELLDVKVSKSVGQTSDLRLHYIGYEVTPLTSDTRS